MGCSGPGLYWRRCWGSLGLGLAFAGRWLVGPLQGSQFAAQSFLALLEPLLHQLLQLPQLLAQLCLDVGLKDAHLAYGGERKDRRAGKSGMSCAEWRCNLGTVSRRSETDGWAEWPNYTFWIQILTTFV